MKGHAELGSTYDTSAVHGIRLASSLEARRNNARLNHMHCLHKRALLNTRGRRYRGPGGSRGRVWLNTVCFARLRLEAHRDHPNTRSCKETAGHCSRVSENFECSATSEWRHAHANRLLRCSKSVCFTQDSSQWFPQFFRECYQRV